MEKLYVIDFMNLAFRNYHAFSKHGLTNSAGEPTGTLHGMTSFMVGLIQDRNPDHIVVAMESDHSLRKEMFADYKKNREGKPSDFEAQLGSVKQMFNLLGIPMLRIYGYEADDVIGCVVNQFGVDKKSTIVSGDKDFMQLVNDDVRLYMPRPRGEHIIASYDEVEDKFGCSPEQVVDVLAIMGDKVDCIPGVNGIGAVGAAKLIKSFGSLDGIYENIDSDQISKAHRKKLEASSDDAFMSQKLAKIATDIPIHLSNEDVRFDPRRLKSSEFLDFLDYYELKAVKNKIFVKLNGLD